METQNNKEQEIKNAVSEALWDYESRKNRKYEKLYFAAQELHKVANEINKVYSSSYYVGTFYAVRDKIASLVLNARNEALKEFADQVKMAFYHEFDELIPSIMADKIDNLVKEMTEVEDDA